MRKILLTFVLNLFAIIATASVQYNGLDYELNGSKNTATVLKSESVENLIIPETIIIEGSPDKPGGEIPQTKRKVIHLHHEHTRTFSIGAVDSAIRDTFKL